MQISPPYFEREAISDYSVGEGLRTVPNPPVGAIFDRPPKRFRVPFGKRTAEDVGPYKVRKAPPPPYIILHSAFPLLIPRPLNERSERIGRERTRRISAETLFVGAHRPARPKNGAEIKRQLSPRNQYS